MLMTLIATFALLLVFLFLWIVFHKKEDSEDKPVTYVCTECGDKHCNCYKEEDVSSGKH